MSGLLVLLLLLLLLRPSSVSAPSAIPHRPDPFPPTVTLFLFPRRVLAFCVVRWSLHGPSIHLMHACPTGPTYASTIRPVAWRPAAASLFWMKRSLRERGLERWDSGEQAAGQGLHFPFSVRPDCEK